MDLFTIPNLSSTQIFKRKPWELEFELPEFKNTAAFKSWCKLPGTKYCAY